MPARLDLYIQRNEDYARTFTVRDKASREPIDLTACTIICQIKSRIDNVTIIEAASILIDDDPTTGRFQIVILAGDGSALHNYGDAIQTANLPYDIRLTYHDGIREALAAGLIVLTRGVSQP